MEPERLPSKKSNRPEPNTNNIDKEKNKNLEAQIADMQDWQDYLEKSLKKYQTAENKIDDLVYHETRKDISPYIEGFAEENNIPSNITIELINLLTERTIEVRYLAHGNSERNQAFEKYDVLVSELLSDKYPAYLEYKKHDNARYYIRQFEMNITSLDNRLDKQQQKDLVAAIYNDYQFFNESIKEDPQPLNDEEDLNIEKMNEAVDLQRKLHNRYLDSARDILSESQLKEFQKYLDTKISFMKEKYETLIRFQEELANRDGN